MKEAKSPKKSLLYYYGIVLAVLLLFNLIVSPMLMQRQVVDTDYGTFMRAIDDKTIAEVQMDDSEILFVKEDDPIVYRTAVLDDPTLTERLFDSGAVFSGTIEQTMNPILSFLLTFVLPVVIFAALGQYMSRKLIEQAGGKNAMSFGMGKSNAKIYVQSTAGIRFSDVAGEDEAKESLAEIVDYLHNPKKYTDVGASMPKGVLLVGPPGTGKTMLAKAVAGESNVPFFLDFRFGVRGDVRRHGRVQGARPVQAGEGEGALHRVHRRDRRHRQEARRTDRRQRRARADAQPAADGDGRLREQQRRHHPRRHQPPPNRSTRR